MAISGSRFWREAIGALRGGSANMAVLVSWEPVQPISFRCGCF
jgi:hypothetical protein